MSDTYKIKTGMIQEEYNKLVSIGEDFTKWLDQEAAQYNMDPDTIQEIIKGFLE